MRHRKEWYEKYKDYPSVPAHNVESAPRHEPVAEKKIPRLDSPCRIHIVSYRYKLCDADGISAKAAIDGLIHGGILPDDSPDYVKEVTYSQVKVGQKSQETTEIVIEEA